MNMEMKVNNMTHIIANSCGGQEAAVVIGANLNMIMTTAQMIPDPKVRAGLAMSFRNIASQLESQNRSKQ